MYRFRTYIAVLLATMLGLTGQAMAVARGMNTATGEMVICSGNGPQTIPIDGAGQPTGPTHICPDCTLSFIAITADPPYRIPRTQARKLTLGFGVLAFTTPSITIRATARGPPVL